MEKITCKYVATLASFLDEKGIKFVSSVSENGEDELTFEYNTHEELVQIADEFTIYKTKCEHIY